MQNVVNIESLDHLFEIALPHQVTLQEFLNRRTYIKEFGWVEITYSHELRDEVITKAVQTIGGHRETKNLVQAVLTRQNAPQHWGLRRFLLQKYTLSAFFGYVPGQDMTWEMNNLRTYLKNQY